MLVPALIGVALMRSPPIEWLLGYPISNAPTAPTDETASQTLVEVEPQNPCKDWIYKRWL